MAKKMIAVFLMCIVVVAALQNNVNADDKETKWEVEYEAKFDAKYKSCYKNCEKECLEHGSDQSFCEVKCDEDCNEKEAADKLKIDLAH